MNNNKPTTPNANYALEQAGYTSLAEPALKHVPSEEYDEEMDETLSTSFEGGVLDPPEDNGPDGEYPDHVCQLLDAAKNRSERQPQP